jgi:hypothetical protein
MFVAVSSNGGIYISLNANNWIQQDSKTTVTLNSITYGKYMFVVVGQLGTEDYISTIITSPDGINWTLAYDSKIKKQLIQVIYENGIFLCVGYGGTLITSPDGINFILKPSGTNTYL